MVKTASVCNCDDKKESVCVCVSLQTHGSKIKNQLFMKNKKIKLNKKRQIIFYDIMIRNRAYTCERASVDNGLTHYKVMLV